MTNYPATTAPTTASACRATSSFATPAARRRYWVILAVVYALGLAAAAGLLAYGNPMPFGTEAFWLLAERRLNAVIAIIAVALCQGVATIAFQTVTTNRIITPSIMGFEALYRAIHTATVFFFGVVGLAQARTLDMFVLQLLLMVGLSLLLYSWLLGTGERSMHAMLLVGIVIGGGLGSVSTFMQRLLTPSEFDVLTARLFASIVNADAKYFPLALPLIGVAVALLLALSSRLNLLALGRDTATTMGLNYRRTALGVLVLVSILMATSTALVGPLTFLGFLVATLAYQFSGTEDHRLLFPMAAGLGLAILAGAYFILHHVFYAQGVVGIIIELVGGLTFLLVILRKGRL